MLVSQKCPKKCYFKGRYFYLECEGGPEKLLVYKQINCDSIVLLPPFNTLWFLPWDLLSYVYIQQDVPEGSLVPYKLPEVSLTALRGKASQKYQIISWGKVSIGNGPIITTGTRLETIFSGIDYLVKWSCKKKLEVGFYCEMQFIGEEVYPLVDNSYKMQINQQGTSGCFIIGSYQEFYVAAATLDGSIADITLEVQVSMPEGIDLPNSGEAEYLEVEPCCRYLVKKNPIINLVTVVPRLNPNLQALYDKIVSTYLSFSLPLPTFPVLNLEANPPVIDDTPIPSYYSYLTQGFNSEVGFVVFTLTNDSPGGVGRIFKLLDGLPYVGISLPNLGRDIEITYRITVNAAEIPALKILDLLCVAAYTFNNTNIAGFPALIRKNGVPIGVDHPWRRVTSFEITGKIIIPKTVNNVVLAVLGGTITKPIRFTVAGQVPNFGKFITYNNVQGSLFPVPVPVL